MSKSLGGAFLPGSDYAPSGTWTPSGSWTPSGAWTFTGTAALGSGATLTSATLTTPVINGTPTGTAFRDRTIKTSIKALSGAAIHAGVVSWVNPENAKIVITRTVIDRTTKSSGASTLDIGTTAVNATTSSDTLIDGLDSGATEGTADNIVNGGTNGKALQPLASGKWVTIAEASGDATGLVGTLYITYFLA